MEQINLSPFLLKKLDELVRTLFKEEYFGFYENSEDYVNNIIDFINTIPSLNIKRHLIILMEVFIVNTNTMLKQLGIFCLISLMTII